MFVSRALPTFRTSLKRTNLSRLFSQAATAAVLPAESIPVLTERERLPDLNEAVARFNGDPLSIIDWAVDAFDGRVAMSTSFGIQSAILLHMATTVKRDIPIVWVDTGYLPKETYQYAEILKETLDLNLTVKTNEEWSPARMEAVYGKLWEKDDAASHALYGRLRKVEPMEDGLNGLAPQPEALFSGLRASQTKARANMDFVGYQNNRFKVLPMLKMSDEAVINYFDKFDLPRHPLEAQGYVTVGDWHSSRPLEAGEDARNTRFGGKFEECGLHVDESEHEVKLEAEQEKVNLESFKKTGIQSLISTEANENTDVAVILVKKILEDGSFCRKCNDVQGKMEKDGIVRWVGDTLYADTRDSSSDGIRIANHFGIKTAPFFLIRTREEQEKGEDWRVVNSYLQLRKMLNNAVTQKKGIDTHTV